MADALRSGRSSPRECGFNSHRRHHFFNSYAISGGRKNGVLRNHVERFVRSGYSVAATPQPSKLLTRVRLPLPAPILFVVGFPSGQRGQTVNLLSLTSMVRIHLPPPLSNFCVGPCHIRSFSVLEISGNGSILFEVCLL